MTRASRPTPDAGEPSAARRLSVFLARFDPRVVSVAEAARAHLRRLFPAAFELVYDNYNALVIGYAPTDKTGDAILSVALYPRWVNLFFLDGARLADPHRVLKGSGTRVRSIRLDSEATVQAPAVRALLEAAAAQADVPMRARGRGQVLIKSVSAKQRPRRPTKG